MAREMTPQERAAIQSFYYRLHAGVEGGEFQERYEQEDIGRIIELLDETRRAALLEAAQVVREFAKHYPTDIFIEPLPGQHGRTVDACSASAIRAICPTIANDIDRLAQEGS